MQNHFARVILYRVSDLILRSKIENIVSLKKKSEEEETIVCAATIEEIAQYAHAPSLLICDLEQVELDDLVRICKTSNTKIVGFYPHVKRNIREVALSKGVDYIVPRSALETVLSNKLSTF